MHTCVSAGQSPRVCVCVQGTRPVPRTHVTCRGMLRAPGRDPGLSLSERSSPLGPRLSTQATAAGTRRTARKPRPQEPPQPRRRGQRPRVPRLRTKPLGAGRSPARRRCRDRTETRASDPDCQGLQVRIQIRDSRHTTRRVAPSELTPPQYRTVTTRRLARRRAASTG